MTAERRLAIIGGGMGGVATAYLCGGHWSTDLFESRLELGGNAKTVIVHDEDQPVAIDIGAESFNQGTHQLYMALLQEIGATDPVDGSTDVRIVTPSTVSIFDAVSRQPLFVSTHPGRTPRYALDFLRFTRAARRFVLSDPSYAVPLGDWVDALPVSASFRDRVLLPWLASLTCCAVSTVRSQSALAFLLLFAPVFPRNPLRLPRAFGSTIGLAGVLQMLVARCERLAVHLDSAVTRLDRVDDEWFVETARGRFGPISTSSSTLRRTQAVRSSAQRRRSCSTSSGVSRTTPRG